MQYSPYSPNLNPYQTIYNNGGAAAYNPQWGYGDAFAHAIGYRSNLPLGYTRQQYNEERALAAESMWKSPLLGLGSFAVGTASMYAIWGSPLKGLAETFGKGAEYMTGFSGKPGVMEIGSARAGLIGLQQHAVTRAAEGAGRAELRAIGTRIAEAAKETRALETMSRASRNSMWGWAGGVAGGINEFHNNVGVATSSFLKKFVGAPVGAVADFGVSGVGGLFESLANRMSGGALNEWTTKAGTDLVASASAEGGFLRGLRDAGHAFRTEERNLLATIRDATRRLGADGITRADAAIQVGRLSAANESLANLRGLGGFKGLLARAKGKIGGGLLQAGKILSTRGVSGLMGAGVGALATGAIGVGSFFASMYLNPLTVAEMYAMEQTVGYAADMYSNYQTENEIKRNLMAKSSRILGYGYADPSRGLQAGLSEVQRNRIVSKVKDLAEIDANKGDLLNLGSNSLLGGHARYSERLKELKSILNVGMDMGFFDMSKSIDDFEKKFEQTVKTVDKLSKFLKKTKGEIMTMMANVQQTEGLYNMRDLDRSVLKKDYAARISGADITTVMQESVAGAQLARQSGFSASFGASVMSTNRIMMSNAIRAGDLTREDIFNTGGEQGVIANLQQGVLNMMNDDELLKETAMDYEYNARTGRYERTNRRINRMRNASASELRAMSRERAIMANRMSYSRIRKTMMVGGELYDRLHYAREDMKNGKLTESDMMSRVYAMAKQRQLVYYNQTGSSAQADELLAQGFMSDYGMEAPIARAMVKSINGGYEQFKLQNDSMIAMDRYRSGYEASGMSFLQLMNTGAAATHSAGGAWATGIGAVAGGIIGGLGAGYLTGGAGALLGAGLGSYVGKAGYAGLAYISNSYDPTGWLATTTREQLKKAYREQGLNPNHVDTYLLGESDSEKIAKLGPQKLAEDLQGIVNYNRNLVTGTSVQDSSEQWRTFITKASSIDEATLKKLSPMFTDINNLTGKDYKDSLAGLLNINKLSDTELKQYGLEASDRMLLSEISKALKTGDTVDMTNVSSGQLERVGKIIGAAINMRGVDNAYRDKNDLRSIFKVGSKTEEQRLNEKFGIDVSNYISDNKKLTFWNTEGSGDLWNWWSGASTKSESEFLEKASKFHNTEKERAWNNAEGFFNSLAAGSDLMWYGVSDRSEQLEYVSKLADSMSMNQLLTVNKVLQDPTSATAKDFIHDNAHYFTSIFNDNSDVSLAVNNISSGREITKNQLEALKLYTTEAIKKKGFKERIKWADESINRFAAKADNTKDKIDKKISTLANIISKDSESAFKSIEEEGASKFIESILNSKRISEEIFTKDYKNRKDLLKDLDDSNKTRQILTSLSIDLIANEKATRAKKETEEKASVDQGTQSNGITAISDKAMANYKEGCVILKEVATKLGYF